MNDQPKQDTLPDLFRTEPKPEAKKIRDEAIDRVERHAGAKWIDKALVVILFICRRNETFFADDYHDAANRIHLPAPPDPRAWGAVIRKARKNGWISKTGVYRESRRPECHAAPKPVYQSHLFKGTRR